MSPSSSPKTSPKLSRVVTSFLEGRRRFKGLACDFEIFEMKVECFIWRLSALEFAKVEKEDLCGIAPELENEDLFLRIERGFGTVGACM
jgi:hypothetical protein